MFKRNKTNSKAISLIICFFFAFILWVYVSYVEIPDMTRRISGIPVIITGESKLNENELAVKSISQSKIDLKIQAKRNMFAFLSPESIKIRADVSSITQVGEIPLALNVEFPSSTSGVSVTDRNKLNITVVTEKYISREFPVVPNITKKPTGGYYLNTEDYNITVTVSGAESTIDSIAYITTDEVDLSDAVNTTMRTVLFCAVDKDKNQVNSVKFSKSAENITFDIYREASVPVTFNLTGDDESITTVAEPDSVTIKGPAPAVDAIESINIGAVNEFNHEPDSTADYTVSAPPNVEFAEGDSVTVTLKFTDTSTQQ